MSMFRRFRRRITLTYTLSALLIAFLSLLLMVGALSFDKYQEEKKELTLMVAQLTKKLAHQAPTRAVIEQELRASEGFHDAYESEHGFGIWQNGRWTSLFPEDHHHLLQVEEHIAGRWQPGFDFYIRDTNDWIFYDVHPYGQGYLVVTCKHKLNFLSEAGLALLFLLPLIWILCWLLGRHHSRQFSRPLELVSSTVHRIAEGHLETRIAIHPKGCKDLGAFFAQLNQTFDRLETLMHSVERFSADVAHELRTPLTSMLGTMEVCLSRRRSSEEYEASFVEVLEEAQRLSRLIDILLTLTRPGEAYEHLFTQADLKPMIEDSLAQMQPLIAESAADISVELPSEALPVYAAPALIQRLLCNLIDNALKFSGEGGKLRLQVTREKSYWRLDLDDNGPGIPPEQQTLVFERFYRRDEARHKKGYGLGLSLSKFIAELHFGSLQAAAAPAPYGGARLSLRLPIPSSKTN